MKFTIIVPTYNSEAYIEELMNSLKNQTYDSNDFEVIVVDDCSKDDTLKKVKKYNKDLNLTVKKLDANSGGPGKPRNTALALAKGEYVFFVDSDDYINVDTLQDVSDFVDENNSDVILVKMEGVNGRGAPRSMFKKTEDGLTLAHSRIIYTLSPTKFYRTALLKEHNIYFPEDLKSAEDQLFTMKAYVHADNIATLADKSYYYATKREGEHMSSAYVKPIDFYKIMTLIVEEILNSDLENKKEIIGQFITRHFSFSRTRNFSLNVKADQTAVWMEALGDFVQTVPKEADQYVNEDIRPLLYYGRNKDFKNYKIVEQSYKNGEFYNSKLEGTALKIQFAENEPFFSFENITQPDVKMSQFDFNDQGFTIELQLVRTIFDPNHTSASMRIKLLSRNKKEVIYLPLTVNNQNRFKFVANLDEMMTYLKHEKVWDVVLEVTLGEMTFDKRIGSNRNKYKYKAETSTVGKQANNYFRFTPYFTKDYDNLSFYVTPIKVDDIFTVAPKGRQKLELTCNEFNYILTEGLTSIVVKDGFTYGYLSKVGNGAVFKYVLELQDKIKSKMFKNSFKLEAQNLTLNFNKEK
ncbi:glycosyltransferase [Staphylococcus sp. 18_1_E_LY]|uniref:Glycosyltransferase n=1 Tax=Staphylococcus lloydii TaxID=2781774 RepID=A0A7T1FAB6_9STAP|nr:glycosyltransferase family 2 protein [Staphylococcus lloydii]MBF7020243.1 glycosyltransferase [Staphylococcus lloydii]MBF7027926.1 glycosyltransferase [Staphylococcus lloydii]QPM75595.1 glycosyltransferase [Staphylococcus lloydii]